MILDLPSTASDLPCIDELAKILTCSICLDIFFEPCTTRCGHSFCKTCLQYSRYKLGRRCPICRQLIRKGETFDLNTALWSTVKQMFPREVEERKTTDDALDGPTDFSGQFLEFLTWWNRRMELPFIGISVIRIVHFFYTNRRQNRP